MFVTVKFKPEDKRTYTYAYNGDDALSPGQSVYVENKDGQKAVTVHELDVPAPSFECKAIIGPVPDEPETEPGAREASNPRAVIGGNFPPDPLDAINAQHEDEREEAANWLDGMPVENEAQMLAVDALREAMRGWRIGLENGQKAATAPLRKVYMDELDRWKPSIRDATRHEECLVAAVDAFKKKLAADRAEAERKAREEQERAAQALRDARAAAEASDLEAQRAVEAAEREAENARIKAAVAKKQATVKGMRTVTRYEVVDAVALAKWLWANDREAQLAAQADRARALGLNLPGVFEQHREKVAA